MNTKKVAGIFLAIMVLAVMLYFYQDYGNSKRIVQDEQQWKTSIEATIKGVEEIAAKSGLPEVVEMANFFKACKFRAIPMAHNSGEIFFGFGEKIPDTRHKIGVTFLSKKDEKLGEAWKEILKAMAMLFCMLNRKGKICLFWH